MFDDTTKAVILGVLRHILTLAGGFLVARGVLDESQVETLVGGAWAILGVLWSVVEKRGRSK